ncbi:type VI secretion protein [Sorangium sp. So ce1000]|uniref:type VI secretion protein n=1 Tax=Sorangium sp. So ce1000 TaxID=3133325 RepID=UPI003F638F67
MNGELRRSLCLASSLSLLALLAGPGCGGAPEVRPLSFEFDVERGANNDSPIPVSIVVVYKESLAKDLLRLTAAQWFERREQIVRDNGNDLDEVLWELVPGQWVKPRPRRLRAPPVDGIIFAGYRVPGVHRFRFQPEGKIRVLLGSPHIIVIRRE